MGLSSNTWRRLAVPALILLGGAGLNSSYAIAPINSTSPSVNKSLTGSTLRAESLDGTSPITVDGTGYRGSIELSFAGGIQLVNSVSLEDYVKGISEVPNAWPKEALRAQAIAARTYVLWQLQTRSTICPTDACQVYKGVTKERSPLGDKWVEAVNSTAGAVLQYKGKPIKAMYSSSNGGHSISGGQPYLKAVPDPEDSASPLNSWTFSLPLSSAASQLGISGTITSIENQSDGWHFRYLANGVEAESVKSSATVRSALNSFNAAPSGRPLPVPSMNFAVSISGSELLITGAGYGHRIGMSQYGAYGKALKGWTAEKIVSNYYGGLKPVQVDGKQKVRVDLGTSTAPQLKFDSPFRIVDEAGTTIAVGASGNWQTSVQGNRVQIKSADVPVAKVSNLRLESAPTKDEAGSVSFDANVPALANLEISNSTGQVVTTQSLTADKLSTSDGAGELFRTNNIVPPGTSRILLPPMTESGSFKVRIVTNPGSVDSQEAFLQFRLARSTEPTVALGNVWVGMSKSELEAMNRQSSAMGAAVVIAPWFLALVAFRVVMRLSGRSRHHRAGKSGGAPKRFSAPK